ncbi:MAG: hypothetical protein GY946_13450 [bacterium]|nr:hypothetical protein [bacterium]
MEIERNLGPQPIGDLLAKHGLSQHDLVAASTEQITHKMVNRAVRGRRLTTHVMAKIRNALNLAAESTYKLSDLFTYAR